MSAHPVRVTIGDVDVTSHVTGLRLEPRAHDTELVFEAITQPLSFSGAATVELDPDEWARLTEHVVFSEEPGRL